MSLHKPKAYLDWSNFMSDKTEYCGLQTLLLIITFSHVLLCYVEKHSYLNHCFDFTCCALKMAGYYIVCCVLTLSFLKPSHGEGLPWQKLEARLEAIEQNSK